jgi:hypothetical protein
MTPAPFPVMTTVMTVAELAKAVCVSTNTICLVRKAGRILGDPIPNYATAADFNAWFRRWPQFTAKDWEKMRWADRLEKYNALDRRAQLVSKYGAK